MGCTASKASSLHVNVVTSPAFSNEVGGKIQISSNIPIQCDWLNDGHSALLQLSSDRMQATNVPCGLYQVVCTAANGERCTISVNVDKLSLPKVERYNVKHATNDSARDGQIEVIVSNLNTDNVRYLWTSGVITEEPAIYDVRPGIYCVNLLSKDKIPLSFHHVCHPAIVEVKESLYCLVQPI